MTVESTFRVSPNGGSAHALATRAGAPAVVLGLDEGTIGIQTARILAERGVPVMAVAGNPDHPSCRTRVCKEITIENTHGDGVIDALERLGRRLDSRAVIFPCADANVHVISRHRERLSEWFEIVLPSHDVVELLTEKDRFYRFATEHGLPVPATFLLRESADVQEAAQGLRFPCILKPVIRTPLWNSNARAKAFRVRDAEELRAKFESHRELAPVMLAQNWVRGEDSAHYSTNIYVDALGELAVSFTTQKLRQWPAGTGQGCLSVEARDAEVVETARRLFELVPFRGLGYLEVKRDDVTGELVIIEPSVGRPTGRSASAEAAGVELLYTMYCDALGLPLPECRQQGDTQTKWIHVRRDTQAAFVLWRKGDLTLRDWWRSWRGPKRDAVFSWRDPAPFVADIGRVLRRAASRTAGL
ncbi:MAG: carboxylate--amine ligase [Gaiellaceae bacterium]